MVEAMHLPGTRRGELPWFVLARDDQVAPDREWLSWLLMGGRGAGKTRAGAEWVHAVALGYVDEWKPAAHRIALVGETLADVREVMVEGASGLLRVGVEQDRPRFLPSRRRLEWPNGAVAQLFSSEDPESLRGPQFDLAWGDELAKWRHAEATWDMLQFGLRLGPRPRQVVTTTPRPIPLLRRLLAEEGTAVSRGRTLDNTRNLAPAFLSRVVGRYAGTRLGRQELDGELIDDRPDALFSREAIEAGRVASAPPLGRIVVAVDPPASHGRGADACGIVACGRVSGQGGSEDHFYVLADDSAPRLKPDRWAARALALWHRLEADALVAEVNQGGDMVSAVLREVDASVPVTPVRATRGKFLRAEPVATLYAQGRVHHVGALPALEDELADFGPDGLSTGRSPDRLDALVWAITALMADVAEPRVRGL